MPCHFEVFANMKRPETISLSIKRQLMTYSVIA